MPDKNKKKKVRLDKLMVEKGLIESREKARALILGGNVLVNDIVIDKAGTLVKEDAVLSITQKMPYVSRGGLKLEFALNHFQVNVKNYIAMDVGASTGGFTDCLLKNGTNKVYAVDVGYGQFDLKLRNDPCVTLLERTNIRNISTDAIPDEIDIATIDVSFISLVKVLPKVLEFLKDDGEVLALIKPQFETGRKYIAKGGVVKDERIRLQVIEKIERESKEMGFHVLGTVTSPIKGPKGNVEYFIYMKKV